MSVDHLTRSGAHSSRANSPQPRLKRISIRVNDDELDLLRERARSAGVSVARLLMASLRTNLISAQAPVDTKNQQMIEQLQKIRMEIHRIGVNVNQVAHIVNAMLEATPDQVAYIVQAIKYCESLIKKLDQIIDSREREEEGGGENND